MSSRSPIRIRYPFAERGRRCPHDLGDAPAAVPPFHGQTDALQPLKLPGNFLQAFSFDHFGGLAVDIDRTAAGWHESDLVI